jgi:outer membrane protein assembly factor BamB
MHGGTDMKALLTPTLLVLLALLSVGVSASPEENQGWPQWANNPQHTGFVQHAGQRANRKLARIPYDPFVMQEKLDSGYGTLVVHYQVPLIEDEHVFIEFKTGNWVPCSPPTAWEQGVACGFNTWNQEIWNEKRLDWQNDQLTETWNFQSDWKPEPNASTGLFGWEPVFHPVLTSDFMYVPGFAGTIWKVDKSNGRQVAHINPFGAPIDRNKYVSSPLTADPQGNIYYNVIKLNPNSPWNSDVEGSWLVKVSSSDATAVVTYATLVPDAPPPFSQCPYIFYKEQTLPWPPSNDAQPPTIPCGAQRPPLNLAPAISPDGTIYTVSRGHFDPQVTYLIAVNPDLSLKWDSSMQQILRDGCGVIVPIATRPDQPNACREGTPIGVDPTTNNWGSAEIPDQGSSSPTVLPDGSILMGVIDFYNGDRGHLLKFNSSGEFLTAYDFGWDITPAVHPHDGTYSIVIKDNHYGGKEYGGLYCHFLNNKICQPLTPGPFDITQLDADLKPEWKFKSTTTDRKNPYGFEWCVNAPAIDANGTVYVNSEDGYAYVLDQGGHLVSRLFLQLAVGAAYTPIALGPDGRIYAQNNGVLFVLGQ